MKVTMPFLKIDSFYRIRAVSYWIIYPYNLLLFPGRWEFSHSRLSPTEIVEGVESFLLDQYPDLPNNYTICLPAGHRRSVVAIRAELLKSPNPNLNWTGMISFRKEK